MSKQALCIKTSDFEQLCKNNPTTNYASDTLTRIYLEDCKGFFNLTPTLESRDTCETDTTLLQVLPYVSLFHYDSMGRQRVYTYQRGGGGGEARLHGDYSIGFGGHIEVLPDSTMSFKAVVVDCVMRELQEEVGINVLPSDVHLAMSSALLFHDTSNDVGKVHLGLSMGITVDPSMFGHTETGIIEKVKAEPYINVFNDMNDPLSNRKFESWSRIVMNADYPLPKTT